MTGIPNLIMYCGLPGSGKSTQAKKYADANGWNVFSSDDLREELFGDVNHQTDNNTLFQELHKRIRTCLLAGGNAIYDATNIRYKQRAAFLESLSKIPCRKICIVMNVPYDTCLKRNAARERKVPEPVLRKMYLSWDTPAAYEGWDDIILFEEESHTVERQKGWREKFIAPTIGFDQKNPHHSLTLYDHMKNAGRWILTNKFAEASSRLPLILVAAHYHDIGKVYAQVFEDSKGNQSEYAHYYGHEHCGSYDVLLDGSRFDSSGKLYISLLIRWHMTPYVWEKDGNERLRKKYKRLWGDRLYEDIMLLHAADTAAH